MFCICILVFFNIKMIFKKRNVCIISLKDIKVVVIICDMMFIFYFMVWKLYRCIYKYMVVSIIFNFCKVLNC